MRSFARFRTAFMALLMAAALVVGCAPSAFAAAPSSAASTAVYEKTEVVYASLAANGAPEAVYVVNRFDVEQTGTVVDHGDYDKVQNLTNETELAREGDATRFEVEEGTLYYQGDAVSTTLPWNVAIAYELDGKKVAAEDLAGASGKLAIHVTTKQNEGVDPAFYDSFMMQITFTLPGDVATGVAAEGATIASAGEDATVAFTVLPGHDGDFTLTADVQDFHMAGAQIAALPYSSVIEMPDTDQMTSGMENLADAVSALADGTSSLASGVDELTSGAQSLSSGAAAFGQGLGQLNGSSGAIVGASGEIKGALAAIAGGLASADLSQLDQLKQLPAGLVTIADGLKALREGAVQAQQGYDASLAALEGAMGALLANAPSEEQIASLQQFARTDEAQAATVGQLVATYRAAQAVHDFYANPKMQQAFAGASQVLATFAAEGGGLAQAEMGLRATAEQLQGPVGSGQLDQLPQLAGGIADLASQYGQFHDGLAQYAAGLSALADNYNQLASGTADLAQGTNQLAGGAGELASGMGQLNASTITLPDTMKEQIAEMTADYDFPEFEPVSFVSPKNEHVKAVQFVLTTAAIEKPEAPQEEESEPELTIWDRFVALFQG